MRYIDIKEHHNVNVYFLIHINNILLTIDVIIFLIMVIQIQKISLLFCCMLFFISNTSAQQLISKSNKQWKIHFGVMGGIGVSNFLQNAHTNAVDFLPEGSDQYEVMYAPRPEATIGIFSELETKCKFSFQTNLAYTMRAIPKPNFGTNAIKAYESLYMNGLTVGGIIFFKPVNKLKVGLGFDFTQFLITKDLAEGRYGNYATQYRASKNIKAVVSYSVSPRADIQVYVAAENSLKSKLQVDNINAGATLAYKLVGREIKLQKEVYKIDYNK